MKELSLNVLDIAMNSVKAKATLINIHITEDDELLKMEIIDNGCGMTAEFLRGVIDPFCTTRTTRKVGLGIPLLKLAAEQTGGEVTITSKHESEYPTEHGTCVTATFYKQHVDFTPMGDIISTVTTLIQGSPDIDFEFRHLSNTFDVSLDTREVREVLGPEIPLSEPEILLWIADNLSEQYKNI
ncbi:MAG: sensor histidine kinase [Ruminococcaceae bacterium]|nr:sensor histidine kinase [Oscillospiraceae bacterium]